MRISGSCSWVACMVAALFFIQCSDGSNPCQYDSFCSPGEQCVEGKCVPYTQTDTENSSEQVASKETREDSEKRTHGEESLDTTDGEGVQEPQQDAGVVVETPTEKVVVDTQPDSITTNCQRDTDCKEGSSCKSGLCVPGCGCTKGGTPVCGVDGKTYENSCVANCQQVRAGCEGSCPCSTQNCSSNEDCPKGFQCSNRVCKPCSCTSSLKACGKDGKTYTNACTARCQRVEVACNQACPCQATNTCTTDNSCKPGTTCQSGQCKACSCTTVPSPVCGTDGKTYTNSCVASCQRVGVSCKGSCPCATNPTCQSDTDCKAGTSCQNGQCKACTCSPTSSPVCGSDGTTYTNSCKASCQRVGVSCKGSCPCPTANEDPSSWYLVQKIFDIPLHSGRALSAQMNLPTYGYPFWKDALASKKYRLFMVIDWQIDPFGKNPKKFFGSLELLLGLPGGTRASNTSPSKVERYNTFIFFYDQYTKQTIKPVTGSIYNYTSKVPWKLKLAPFGGGGKLPKDRGQGINVFDLTDSSTLKAKDLYRYVHAPFLGNVTYFRNTVGLYEYYVRDIQLFLARKGSRTPISQPYKFGECRKSCTDTMTIGGVQHRCLNYKYQYLPKTLDPKNSFGVAPRAENQKYIGGRWMTDKDYLSLFGSQYRRLSGYCVQRLCGNGDAMVNNIHPGWTSPGTWLTQTAASQRKEIHDGIDNNCDGVSDENFTGVPRAVPVLPGNKSSIAHRRDSLSINGTSNYSNYYILTIQKGKDAVIQWDYPTAAKVQVVYKRNDSGVQVNQTLNNKASHTVSALTQNQDGKIFLLDAQNAMLQFFPFRILVK